MSPAGPAVPDQPPDAPDVPDAPAVGARRVVVGFDRVPRWLDGVAERHGPVRWTATPVQVSGLAADGTQVWVDVPYPPLVPQGPGLDDAVAALVAHVQRPRRIGLILVRRGGYGVGVFADAELVASKVGSSYVQGTTKAGGWSQQRFARRRANQARFAFATAADAAARVVLPHAADLDAVVCGGDHAAVDAVLSDPRLAPLADRRGGPWLAVPDPRLSVVVQAPRHFLACTIRIRP